MTRAEDNAKVLETIYDFFDTVNNISNKDITYMDLALNEILTVLCDMSTSLAVIADSLSIGQTYECEKGVLRQPVPDDSCSKAEEDTK